MGGFPEHVGKFAYNYGIKYESDYEEYKAVEGECHAGEFLSGKREFFTNAAPIGGYFGAVSDPTEI